MFKPVCADSIDKIKPFFDLRSSKSCDSVFFDYFLWKDFNNIKYAIFKDKYLFFTIEAEGSLYAGLPICKDEDLKGAFFTLKQYFNNVLNQKLKIYLADEKYINILNLDKNEFAINELFDSRDYIYLAENLKILSGKKLRKKKNHINSFLKENEGNFYYKKLFKDSKQEILSFLNSWKINKTDNLHEQLDAEIKALENVLDNFDKLDVYMAGIYVNSKLEAFSIGSYNKTEKMAIIHIEKANANIRGLYPYINQQFIINEFADALFVNREDDLGLESLRKAKLSYAPIDFVKKYRISEI